jgi:uncharacterized protein (DUF1778 family)
MSTLSRELKSARLELRLAPSAKAVIQRAMAISGLAAGDLAYEGARKVLEDHERMILSGQDRDAFMQALAAPSAPNAALVEAIGSSLALVS